MRPAADRGGDDEDDLIGPGAVGHAELDRVEMAAHIGRRHMMQRNVDARAGRRHLDRRGHDRLGASTVGLMNGVADAEARRLVPQRGMLEFAREAHDHTLAIGFELRALGVEQLHHPLGEIDRQRLERLHHRLYVLDVAAGVGIGDHAAHHGLEHRLRQGRATVVVRLL